MTWLMIVDMSKKIEAKNSKLKAKKKRKVLLYLKCFEL